MALSKVAADFLDRVNEWKNTQIKAEMWIGDQAVWNRRKILKFLACPDPWSEEKSIEFANVGEDTDKIIAALGDIKELSTLLDARPTEITIYTFNGSLVARWDISKYPTIEEKERAALWLLEHPVLPGEEPLPRKPRNEDEPAWYVPPAGIIRYEPNPAW